MKTKMKFKLLKIISSIVLILIILPFVLVLLGVEPIGRNYEYVSGDSGFVISYERNKMGPWY